MPLLTVIIDQTGGRKIIHDGPSRSSHTALLGAVVQSAPAGVSGVEFWDSNGGRGRAVKVAPGSDAPSVESVISAHEKTLAEDRKKVEAAQKADQERVAKAEGKPKPAKKAAKKK